MATVLRTGLDTLRTILEQAEADASAFANQAKVLRAVGETPQPDVLRNRLAQAEAALAQLRRQKVSANFTTYVDQMLGHVKNAERYINRSGWSSAKSNIAVAKARLADAEIEAKKAEVV